MNSSVRIKSLLLFLAGVVLLFPGVSWGIIHLINNCFNTELDFPFRQTGILFLGYCCCLVAVYFYFEEIKQRNPFFIAIIPIVAFYSLLFLNAVNIPINDDYETILGFSCKYADANSWSKKYILLTQFYWESRLITTRLLVLLENFLLGHIDIKWLILSTNLSLLITAKYLIGAVKNKSGREYIILCIVLLLFNLGYYDAVFWANDAIHYQFTVLFLSICFYWLMDMGIRAQIISSVSAMMAVISFGNGLLVFPIAIVLLLLNGKKIMAAIWLVPSTLFYLWYFNDSPHPELIHFHHLRDYFEYSCLFLGNIFQFQYQSVLPFIAGASIWLLFIWLMFKKIYIDQPLITGMLLFCLASSLIAAQFRLNLGVEEALSNRYGIFSVLALVAVVIGCYNMTPAQMIIFSPKRMVFAAFVLYAATGFFYFPEVPVRKVKLQRFLSEHVSGHNFQPIAPILPVNADSILCAAEKRGIFTDY